MERPPGRTPRSPRRSCARHWISGAARRSRISPTTPSPRSTIARLEERRLGALEERIEADLELGRHGELVAELATLAQEHPLRERIRGAQMLALYRSDRQADALAAYQAARRALVDELGIEPGHALHELERRILTQDHSLDFVAAARDAGAPAVTGTGAGRPRGGGEERPRRSGALLGRERELGELCSTLEEAISGRGRLFLVSGEPGIGKSRLFDEFALRAGERGVRVLWGRCWEAGGAPAYWPWCQSLRSYVRTCDPGTLAAELGAGASDVAQLVPEIRELLPGVAAPSRSRDPDTARFRLFDATAAFLRRTAARDPLVLVLDDLHAADTPSLFLLQFLARELGEAPDPRRLRVPRHGARPGQPARADTRRPPARIGHARAPARGSDARRRGRLHPPDDGARGP